VILSVVVALGAIAGAWWYATAGARPADAVELLNVSYDPTRELWRDLNTAFIPRYEQETGVHLEINQSHGGSSSQARAVIEGLEADVVTLALWTDTDALRKKGLLADGWEGRLPNHSLPYYSTIVFVVRKGNPKGIHDWPDLVRPGVQVITPSPKTSGNGKLSFLAAWGAALRAGGTPEQAQDYVRRLYRQAPVLDPAARGATVTFSQKKIGDVHLTWENEAHLELAEAAGELEIIYPKYSFRAEPHVAVVDQNVDRKGTRAPAEAYLKFL
jgi:sulfate transport system substrate-binding protein